MIQEVGANQNSGGNVPPPPAEVKVRTMRSDVEGMEKMGGGLPQFKTVSVSGAPSSANRTSKTSYKASDASSSGDANKSFLWWIVVAGIVALGLVAWFGYVVILKK